MKYQTCLNVWLIVCIFSFVTSCYKEDIVDLEADFEVSVLNDDYSVPVEIAITNTSRGADRYVWHFEGGIPATSDRKSPENIWYREAGTYQIRLECWYKERLETKEYTFRLDSAIRTAFDVELLTNAFAPVSLQIENRSTGSSFYRWHFDGGSPATSEAKHPPLILYETPGEYIIRLTTGNEREETEISRTIQVLPRMEADFTCAFSFDDEDRQVPAVVFLESQTLSVLNYKWEVPGGKIDNDVASSTFVSFETPGVYTITLETSNGKETKRIEKEVELLPNTNLLSMKDVHLGLNSSTEKGMFFSGYLRKAITKAEIEENEDLGKQIDWVFFGLSNRFNYCRFLSPDSAHIFTFSPIPEAIKTYVVNDVGKSNLRFSVADFDAMENDSPLRPLDIKLNDTGNFYFELNRFPYLVLFETEDGRKGAIKINKTVDRGINSYLEADVKMQKEKSK
jgi:PKD repeat protein